MAERGPGYRTTLAHPVAGRLWASSAVSVLGDYVGQGALLLLAFERTGGRALGPAALFAVQAVPAILSGGFAGSWLDQVPRRRALIGIYVAGGLTLALPIFLPGLVPVLAAAALLGALRVAAVSVRSGAIAEAVPEENKGSLLALFGTTDQFGQVIGFLTGASIAVLVGSSTALLADAATFFVASAIVAVIPFPPPEPRQARPPAVAGLSAIFRNPVLRLLAPLVWVSSLVGALPETLAPAVTGADSSWTPFVLAAGPAGQALTFAFLGRRREVERPSFQIAHLAWFALAFGIAAFGRSPAFFVVGNLLVGSGTAWLLGPQTLFVRVAPPQRMAQITGTMVAVIIASEGVGTLIFASIADALSVPAAYRAAGALILLASLVGWYLKERTPEATELDRTI